MHKDNRVTRTECQHKSGKNDAPPCLSCGSKSTYVLPADRLNKYPIARCRACKAWRYFALRATRAERRCAMIAIPQPNGSVRTNGHTDSAKIRHSASHPCPVCGGQEDDARRNGKRCFGFTVDGWCHCTREEYAGNAKFHAGSSTYSHILQGPCLCGKEHGATVTALTRTNGKAKAQEAASCLSDPGRRRRRGGQTCSDGIEELGGKPSVLDLSESRQYGAHGGRPLRPGEWQEELPAIPSQRRRLVVRRPVRQASSIQAPAPRVCHAGLLLRGREMR